MAHSRRFEPSKMTPYLLINPELKLEGREHAGVICQCYRRKKRTQRWISFYFLYFNFCFHAFAALGTGIGGQKLTGLHKRLLCISSAPNAVLLAT